MFAKSFGDLGQILGAFSGGCLGKSQRKVCNVLERFEPHSGGALGDCLADRSGVLANSLDICWTLVTFLGDRGLILEGSYRQAPWGVLA